MQSDESLAARTLYYILLVGFTNSQSFDRKINEITQLPVLPDYFFLADTAFAIRHDHCSRQIGVLYKKIGGVGPSSQRRNIILSV